jgi:predicted nucleic acid-binding Zn ribbon protein
MKNANHETGFFHIGGIIEKVLRDYHGKSGGELIRVRRLWEDVVGKEIAANAQPAAFKANLLLVHVQSSTWIQQLQFLKKDILLKLNAALGKTVVEEIKFKIGPLQ